MTIGKSTLGLALEKYQGVALSSGFDAQLLGASTLGMSKPIKHTFLVYDRELMGLGVNIREYAQAVAKWLDEEGYDLGRIEWEQDVRSRGFEIAIEVSKIATEGLPE